MENDFGTRGYLLWDQEFWKNATIEDIENVVNQCDDINDGSSSWMTPLHYAAELGKNPKMVKVLLDHGADVNKSVGDGKIETDGISFAATAGWQRNEIYVDGQLQYAEFTSDLATDDAAVVSGNDGSSFSLSGEVGYRLPLRDLTLVPQAQLVWTNVEFDDFTDSTLARITLEDGSALTGRLGVFMEREFPLGVSEIDLHASADMYLPLDEEIETGMAGDTLVSEKQEWYYDMGAGASYKFGDGRSFFGEVSTVFGEEVEEYKAGMGFRFGF